MTGPMVSRRHDMNWSMQNANGGCCCSRPFSNHSKSTGCRHCRFVHSRSNDIKLFSRFDNLSMIAAASNINAMASSSGNRKQLPENNGSDDEPSAVAKPNPGTHPSLSSQNVSNRSSDKKKCYNGDARNENPQYSKTTSVELVAATAAASAPPCDSANFDSTTTTTTKTTDLYKHSDPVVKGNMLLLSDESESSAVSSTLTPQGAALRRQKLVCHVDNIRIPPLATTATPNNSVVVTLANNASYTTPPVTKEIFPGKAAVVAMAAASQENDALLAESDLTLESSSGTIKNCSILSNTTTTTTIASMGEVSLGGSLRQQQQHLHLVNAACQAVLAVMRLDPRYIASTRFGNSNIHSDEVLAQDVYLHSMYETFHRQTMSLSSSSLSSNQLLARHNHNFSHCPVTTRRTGRQSNEDESYVKVFCDAVRRQDTSAAVTLAVLDGLYSFVQNGLIVHQHQLDQVATALVQCAFEDTLISTASTHSNNNPVPAVITGLVPPSTEATTNTSTTSGTTTANIPAVAPRLERRSSRIAPQSSAVPTNSLSHSLHDHHSHFPGGSGDDSFDDEPAVLRLLQLIELVVQTDAATNNDMDLSSDLILSLLETCWHVRHKAATASPLLKHAAGSTAQQIVNAVFTTVSTHNVIARCEILRKLSSLLMSPDPDSLPGPKQLLLSHEFATVHVLTLIMSILVSINVSFGTTERSVLEETVVREVIALAIQTTNAAVLRHCLRVCHQLLNVMHLHSMKYELEVLVHAVYLRRLDENSTSSPEEREVVLENLSQLCFNNSCTAASLRHLYWNYDCDFACTNLYEAIVVAFGRTAWECPDTRLEKNRKRSIKTANVDSIDTSRQLGNERDTNSSVATTTTAASSTISTASNKPLLVITISNQSPLNVLNVMALDCIFSVIDMIESNATLKGNATVASGATEPIRENTDDTNQGLVLICSEALSEKAVQSNKQTKNDLFAVACSFNKENPEKGEWLSVAIEKGLLQSITDSKAVAQLLHSLPEVVDKQRLGIYLSRGPDEKFPFQAKIRKSFTAMYNFTGLSFQAALRSFLSKFRLPGEAQCIDRLMEAFSKEYFDQQKAITDFKNSDAVYVLAFSTIMLNTDLHNPTIKTEQRMTKEQFIRNNRGINGGSDLPKDFLADLFDQIKDRALKVRSLSSDVTVKGKHDFLDAWDNVTQKKKGTVISVYVPLRRQGGAISQLDREMFALLSKFCLHSIFGIFSRTWDDSLVVRSLRGLQQIVVLAAHFELDYVINDVLQALLPLGREYIVNCIANDQATATLFDGGTSVETLMHSSVSDYIPGEEDAASAAENDQNIPFGLLCSNDGYEHVDISGSATHRGLLALDASFVLLRQNASRVTSAWPAFIECICVLRDARALPAGLSDLDDFADSSGKVLPLSSFARSSHKRLEAYHKSLADKDATKQKGWFRSFFRKGKIEDQVESDDIEPAFTKGRLSVCARTLLGIADAANVENILQMGSSQLPDATIRTLLDGLDSYPFENDPAGEQHAVFTLELAARALLSNRERAEELFVLFLSKFEKILMKISDTDAHVAAPFVIERVVVTILRSSIHLYENSMLRPQLRTSLQLLTITLPKHFIRAISDRMACGLAIILRASYHLFETHNEWSFMGETFDMLAKYSTSRVLVFDGIASTVEYAFSNSDFLDDSRRHDDVSMEDDDDRPRLSIEACTSLSRILTRFVLGFYQNDLSLSVPAMLCLEKVYRRKVEILLSQQVVNDKAEVCVNDIFSSVPDKDLWQNVAVAVYSVCRSSDPEASNEGLSCYRRIVLRTSVDQIPDDKWIAILYLMVNKQPSIGAEVSRGNTFTILGHLLVRVLPSVSHQADHREDLEDLVSQYAALAEENLHQSRHGCLFEMTLQTLTYICNLLVSDEWKGNSSFSAWASETLLKELDRAGNNSGQLVTTTNSEESDDVSEISDSVAEDDDSHMSTSRR